MALRRLLGMLALLGVLVDANACLVAYSKIEPPLGEIGMSAQCPCGCKAHTGALGGIGITQLAATPAEITLPDAPRVAPEAAALPALPRAPSEPIDHVPILLS